ncbi:MAG: protein phosphatase 2C domain-containing protein, partial [Planctomycetales bacterium]|nr:protein phosphatase 2C domain-containing protein [Planctomycetales bacterium]
EDALALIPLGESRGVLAIADGCGGQANGQQASRLAITALAASLAAWEPGQGLRAGILDGFENASRRVRALGTGAATTLVAVEIDHGILRTFHVGDSQALLVGSRGKVKLQTPAHSPVGYAQEAGLLSEKAALQHEDRHLVSNVIGDNDSHIALGLPRQLAKRDTLLMGSDGLFDNLRQDEIVQLIRKGPLLQAAQAIQGLIAQRMSSLSPESPSKPDDLALLLYRQTAAGPTSH